MTPAFVFGLALVINASIDRLDPPEVPGGAAQMTSRQKDAAVRPLVRSATECVARTVSASPGFAEHASSGDINDLIVASMASCVDAMRAMIDAYDRYYGSGAGETFFSGPYLDILPAAEHRLLERNVE